jgi:hypothetical protein
MIQGPAAPGTHRVDHSANLLACLRGQQGDPINMFRTILLLIVCGGFLAAVVWLLPIEGILSARGYSEAEIATLKQARQTRVNEGTAIAASEPGVAPSQGTGAADAPAPKQTGTSTAAQSSPDTRATSPTGGEQREALAPGRAGSAQPKLVATDTINVRGGPGTDNPVTGKVYPDQTVTVLRDSGEDWIEIQRDDVRGWAFRPLFKSP